MSREMKDSGIDWIGKIPSTWNLMRIKDIVVSSRDGIRIGPFGSALTNKTASQGEYYIYGQYNLINDDFLNTKHKISESTFNKLQAYEVLPNDICLSMMGTIGKCKTVPSNIKRGIMDSHLIKIRLNERMLNKYFEYVYDKDYGGICFKQMQYDKTGSIMDGLNTTVVKNLYLPVPSISEQKTIVNYLNSKCLVIDLAIQKQKDIVNKLMEYKQSTITQAVIKGLNPNVKMKDSEIDWIRRIPESWDIIPLKVLFKENKKRNTDLTNSNLLSLSYGRIIQKNIDSNFGLLPDNFSKYTIVNDGDIVLRLTDLQNDHKSLRTGLVTQSGIITSAYVTLTPKKKLCSRYFHYLLHSYDIQKVFYTMGEGIRQSLSYDELSRNIRLIMPSFKEQQSIANYLDSKCLAIDESIKRSNKIIQKLEEYKKSLVYNAVTGKIDCRGEVK